MAALLTEADGLDIGCDAPDATPVAVLNWYGPSDLSQLLAVPSARGFTSFWLGDSAATPAFQWRVSPIAYVRTGGPAVFSAHGGRDDLVPVEQSRRLHAALDSAKVPNRLVELPTYGHEFESAMPALLDSARAFLGSALRMPRSTDR
jgi:dipeptidyl aminopeptidase/acylaminoacyl peptidase